MADTKQAEQAVPQAPTRSAERRTAKLAKQIGAFAGQHGGAEGQLAYIGQRGTRIVLVGDDGAWGDLVAPTYDVAKAATEKAGITVHENFDGDFAAKVETGPYEWKRMAGIQIGGGANRPSGRSGRSADGNTEEAAVEPVAKPAGESVESLEKAPAGGVEKPAVEPVEKPAVEPVKPAVGTAAKPAGDSAEKPAVESAGEPGVESAGKPAGEAAEKPVAESAGASADEGAEKPVGEGAGEGAGGSDGKSV